MSESEEGLDPTSIRDPLLGAKVLGYELRRRIGVGGMGVVYEAEELNIGRKAAVKVLLPEVANQPHLVERLKAEARAANAARHRGIIDIFGFAELPNGRNAIVMEYLDGIPLDQRLAELTAEGRRIPSYLALAIIDELASVLQAAHDAGVVHRDLKPSNIFLCRNADGSTTVKVLDFGIAKFEGLKAGPQTAANTVMGTPAYMSPEQAQGEQASPPMDLYALGVVSFELFTGRTPFIYESLTKVLLAHQQEKPVAPSTLAPGLPAVLDAFVLKLLEKDPARRHRSGNEVRDDVRALRKVFGDPEAVVTEPQLPAAKVTIPPAPITEQVALPKGMRSSRGPIVALVVCVVALLVAVIAVKPGAEPSPPSEPPVPVAVPTPVPVPAPEPTPEPEPTPAPQPISEPVADPPQPLKDPRAVTGTENRRKALRQRLRKLEKRLQLAASRGEPTTLYQQQLDALTNALKAAPSNDKLEAIDTAVGRLEAEVP